ncbi:response regulator [Methanobacterium sp. ACI-7]|uniref:response regulator n=1 Tax=unclassified Methanobacterium TaxID=2627676 RepID=UPI0039C0D21C
MQAKPIKILMIEDSKEDVFIIQEMLRDNSRFPFELIHVERLKVGFEKLFQENFDLLLLDLNLPDSWGFDTFIRTYDQAPELPIVILSGFDDEDTAIKAVREGAQDYLIKGEIDGSLLARSIYYAIERKEIEKELMNTQKDLRKLIEWHEHELKETEAKLKEEVAECKLLEEKLEDASQQLKMEKSKLNTIINRLPLGILIVDASSGKPIIRNKKLEDIWGECLGTDELAEYCYYNGSHPDGKPYELDDWPLTRSINHGEEVEDQTIIISEEDRPESVISITAIPIKDDEGQVIMGVSLFSEITDSECDQ